jgi:hypothetical protein
MAIQCYRCQRPIDEPELFMVRDDFNDFAVCRACWHVEPFTVADALSVPQSVQALARLRGRGNLDDDLYDW